MTEIRVEQVAPELTYALRQRVLRPHLDISAVRLAGDDDPLTATFAARTPDGEVVGSAIVRPEPCPWRPADPGAWRLRGMATDEALRGQGVGGHVLRSAIAHVVLAGGELIWCNARTPARSFYERAGFEVHGEEWVDPQIGPHVAMWRRVYPVVD